jgi:hypothetical protein
MTTSTNIAVAIPRIVEEADGLARVRIPATRCRIDEAMEPSDCGSEVPELPVDDCEAVVHVGKSASEREPYLDRRGTHAAGSPLVYLRYTLVELRPYDILIWMRVGQEADFVCDQAVWKPS